MHHAGKTTRSTLKLGGWLTGVVLLGASLSGCATIRAYQSAQAESLAGCQAVCVQQLKKTGGEDCTCWVPRENAVYHLRPRLASASLP